MATDGDLKVPDSEAKDDEIRGNTFFIENEDMRDTDYGGPNAQQDIQLLDSVNEALYHYERVNKQFFKMQSTENQKLEYMNNGLKRKYH